MLYNTRNKVIKLYIYSTIAFEAYYVTLHREEIEILTIFRMDFLELLTNRGAQKSPLPKICRTYPPIMKLDTVIP